MKAQDLAARLYGLWRLLRQPVGPRTPQISAAENVEPQLHSASRWRALSDDPQFRVEFGGGLPLGLCRVSGWVAQPGHAVLRPKLFFGDGCSFAEVHSHELIVSAGLPFRATVYVPLWCRILRWDPTSAAGEFDQALATFDVLGWRATLRFLLRARLSPLRRRLAPLRRRLGYRTPSATGQGLTADAAGYVRHREQTEPDLDEVRDAVLAHQTQLRQPIQIALVIPAARRDQRAVLRSLAALRAQSWGHWSATLVIDRGDADAFAEPVRDDSRVRLHERTGAAGALADAISAASGDYLMVIRPGDLVAPLALYCLAAAINADPDCALIYADDDQLGAAGGRSHPRFKPGWNPELLWSQDYIGAAVAMRRDQVTACGGWRDSFGDAAGYELLLRLTRELPAQRIRHLPLILLHRAPPHAAAPAQHTQHLRALREHFSGCPGTRVEPGLLPASHRVVLPLPAPPPKVSVIVPSRDGYAHLKTCIDSLLERSRYPQPELNLELILVDNQSRDPATLALFEHTARRPGVRLLRYDAPFNFSAINNRAAGLASGAVLILLNDDTEVLSPHWLEEMVTLALRPDVGAVGAKLYYPDGSVQHGGLGLGIGGVAGHLHLGAPHDADGYLGRLKLTQAVGAVTGACLAVQRSKYLAVGGLDEQNLSVALNDVDLCLRLAERGWRSVWTPHAELVHHESRTRGADNTPEKQALFEREYGYMRRRWELQLSDDIYYHRNLTRSQLDLGFADAPRPWWPWLAAADALPQVEPESPP